MSRPLVEIKGFPELVAKLKLIADDRTKRAEMLKVLRKAAQGTVRAARQNVPVSRKPHVVSGKRTHKVIQPGSLRKSIGVITGKKGQAKDNPTVYVGPRAKGVNDGFYGHFVEYGHGVYHPSFRRKHSASDRARLHNASGLKSRTEGQPFMKETYNQTKGQVTEETAAAVAKVIQKVIDKHSR